EVLGLLLTRTRAEVKRAVEPDRGKGGHVRPCVAPHGGQPEDLRPFEDVDDLRPRSRRGLGAAESFVQLRAGFGCRHQGPRRMQLSARWDAGERRNSSRALQAKGSVVEPWSSRSKRVASSRKVAPL